MTTALTIFCLLPLNFFACYGAISFLYDFSPTFRKAFR